VGYQNALSRTMGYPDGLISSAGGLQAAPTEAVLFPAGTIHSYPYAISIASAPNLRCRNIDSKKYFTGSVFGMIQSAFLRRLNPAR
jgi:hypothetical protein